MYETHWEGLSSITWEREIDLKNFSRLIILEYWMPTPKTSEGCKLQVLCHAQSPGTQSLLTPQEQVLPKIGIPSSVIQYLLGKGNSEGGEYRFEPSFGGKTIKVGDWNR